MDHEVVLTLPCVGVESEVEPHRAYRQEVAQAESHTHPIVAEEVLHPQPDVASVDELYAELFDAQHEMDWRGIFMYRVRGSNNEIVTVIEHNSKPARLRAVAFAIGWLKANGVQFSQPPTDDNTQAIEDGETESESVKADMQTA